MNPLPRITTAEFEKALTPGVLRIFRFIHIGLMMGVIAFMCVVLILFGMGKPQESVDSVDLLNTLSLVHVALAMGAFVVSRIIFKAQFRPERIAAVAGQMEVRASTGNLPPPSLADKYIGVMRLALLIRIAVMEGPAFFGLVVSLLGTVTGVTKIHPEYLLNLSSGLALVAFIILTFPTKERLVSIFEEKIKGGL